MIATFFIEVGLALYIVLFRKMNLASRLSIFLLVCLAIFQLAEYGICESWGASSTAWVKIGFVAITLLPPLGLHLVYVIGGRKIDWVVRVSYLVAVVWIGFFIFGTLLKGAVCEGNYVIFHIPEPHEGWYYFYYNVTIVIAMTIAYTTSKVVSSKRTKAALQSLIVGYLAFIVPSIVFTTFDSYSGTDSPLPSIMCGFAVLFALILTINVVPKVTEKK